MRRAQFDKQQIQISRSIASGLQENRCKQLTRKLNKNKYAQKLIEFYAS